MAAPAAHRVDTARARARSRRAVRYRRAIIAASGVVLLGLSALLVTTRIADERAEARAANKKAEEDARRAHEADLIARNIGTFDLQIALFEWDEAAATMLPADARQYRRLRWALFAPSEADPDSPGNQIDATNLIHGTVVFEGGKRIESHIAARGGDAFIEIDGRGLGDDDCGPSIIAIHPLPGHGAAPRKLTLSVPTCSATRANLVAIPPGPFIADGRGEPPASFPESDLRPRRRASSRPIRSIARR